MAEMAERDRLPSLILDQQSLNSRVCKCLRPRTVGSKSAVLVTIWTYLVWCSFINIVWGKFASLEIVSATIAQASIVGLVIVVLLGPLTGLIASVYFGRYKTVCASFWLMWFGTVTIAIILMTVRLIPEAPQLAAFSVIVMAEIFYFIGFTAFTANSVPFGLDQMPDASAEQITAFIHWFFWSDLAAMATATLPYMIRECSSTGTFTDKNLIISSISAFLMTLTLCSNFLFHKWLIIEPEAQNPLKNIFKILKFAAKHKTPLMRSAFTYCETERPSRLDLAKSKYGGPHTYEEVEDVKTLLRMLVIVACITVTTSFCCAVVASELNTLHVMFSYSSSSCNDLIVKLISFFSLCLFFSLPVYDATVYPCIKKCFSSTLRRVGFALILYAFLSLFWLVSTTVWYMSTSPTYCMYVPNESFSSFQFDRRFFEIPMYVMCFGGVFILYGALMEFVCAQTPYSLRGVLVGLTFSMMLLTVSFGTMIYNIWKTGYRDHAPDSSTCGVWFYLFTTISTVLGFALWCVVAKWYKKREREEPEMCRIYAENYYSK